MAPRDDKKKSGLGCGVCLVIVVVLVVVIVIVVVVGSSGRDLSRSSGWGSPCQDARGSSFWRKDTYRLPDLSRAPFLR